MAYSSAACNRAPHSEDENNNMTSLFWKMCKFIFREVSILADPFSFAGGNAVGY
jgi:hypothetical protein